MTTTTAWAIKAPDGYPIAYNIRKTRKQTIESFCYKSENWKHWYLRGYRCVRVQITEVQG